MANYRGYCDKIESELMKHHFLLIFSLLVTSLSVNAGGPWKSVDSFITTGHPAVITAVSFITAANKGNYELAKSHMTADYIYWRQKLMGLDTFLAVFENADLDRLFQCRLVSEESEFVRLDFKFFSESAGREESHRMNLVLVDNSWKLTYRH